MTSNDSARAWHAAPRPGVVVRGHRIRWSGPGPAPAELLRQLQRGRGGEGPVLHVERIPARAGLCRALADWAPAELPGFAARGIDAAVVHQVEGRGPRPRPAAT